MLELECELLGVVRWYFFGSIDKFVILFYHSFAKFECLFSHYYVSFWKKCQKKNLMVVNPLSGNVIERK